MCVYVQSLRVRVSVHVCAWCNGENISQHSCCNRLSHVALHAISRGNEEARRDRPRRDDEAISTEIISLLLRWPEKSLLPIPRPTLSSIPLFLTVFLLRSLPTHCSPF